MTKPKKDLSKNRIESIQPTDKRQEIPDALLPSFYLVVQPSPSCAKSFAIRYRRPGDGRSAKMTIGQWPRMSLAEARDAARKAFAKLQKGEDPVKRVIAPDGKEETVSTFGALADLFLKRHASKLRPGTVAAYERLLRLHVRPRWQNRKFVDIRRADVRLLLEGLTGKALPNRVQAVISAVFAFATERELIDSNPCVRLKKQITEEPRERVLTDAELALVLSAIDTLPNALSRDYSRFLLLSMQRRCEVSKLTWKEIDRDERSWTLSSGRAKNRRPHYKPLSAEMMRILDRRDESDGCPFVFPGSRGQSFKSFDKLKIAIDAAATKLNGGIPLANWRFHDWRRTAATNAQKLGVNVVVTEKLLSHTSGTLKGVAGIYQRHNYVGEMRDALEAWAAHLQGLRAKGRGLELVGGQS